MCKCANVQLCNCAVVQLCNCAIVQLYICAIWQLWICAFVHLCMEFIWHMFIELDKYVWFLFRFLNGTFVSCTEHPVSETAHPVSERHILFPKRHIRFRNGTCVSRAARAHISHRHIVARLLSLSVAPSYVRRRCCLHRRRRCRMRLCCCCRCTFCVFCYCYFTFGLRVPSSRNQVDSLVLVASFV